MGNEDALAELQRAWTDSRFYRPKLAPIPPVEDNTRYLDAGVVRLGVESRVLNTEMLEAHQRDLGLTPDMEIDDSGASFHVIDADDGYEYLRFDCFDDFPHYHYLVPGIDGVTTLGYDPVANGEMVPWVLRILRERLPAMLRNAGAFALADRIDIERVAAAVDEAESLVEAM